MKRLWPFLLIMAILALVGCHREEVGWIAVNSEPQGAAVYLDDSLTEEVTNCVLEDVPVGEHALKLTLDGYVDWDTLVEVEAESPTTITAVMTLKSDTTDTIPPGTLLWKSSMTSEWPGCVLYSNETVYIVGKDNTTLYALNEEDGTVKWQYEAENDHILKLPMIGTNGNIYLVEERAAAGSNHMKIVNLYPDGSIRWRIGRGEETYEAYYGAVDSDNSMYLSCMNFYGGFSLEAYSEEGTLEWTYPLAGPASISIGAYGQIYALVTDSAGGFYSPGLYALNPDGTYEWHYQLTKYDYPDYYGMAIGQAGEIYFADVDRNLIAIDRYGFLKWAYSEFVSTQSVVGEDGTIYFGSYPYLYALNQDGSFKWRKNMSQSVLVTPLIGADGTVYCDGVDGLYALDAEDGAVKWKYEPTSKFAIRGQFALTEDGILLAWIFEEGESSYHLHAIKTESQGLANSSWPKYQADNKCSGCARW